jgi:hypothetical protein
MVVSVDNPRHDSLAREIDAGRAGRGLEPTLASDCAEPIILDEESGVFDGSAAVPNDEPRAFEQGCLRGLRGGVPKTNREQEQSTRN